MLVPLSIGKLIDFFSANAVRPRFLIVATCANR
jgi:hypothetical protein